MSKEPKTIGSIEFLGIDGVLPLDSELSLLDLALKHQVPLNHSCGGMGTCTTCRVIVVEGLEDLEPRNEIEEERSEERGFSEEERLACQILAKTSLKLRIPG